jgi:hypothetical protein
VSFAVPPARADPEPSTNGGSPTIALAARGDRQATAELTAVPLKTHHPTEPSTWAIFSTTRNAVMGSVSGPPNSFGT